MISIFNDNFLGDAPALPASVVNYKVPVPTAPAATTGNFWSGLNNVLTKVTGTVNTLAPAVTNVKGTIDALKSGNSSSASQGAAADLTYNADTGAYEMKPTMSKTTKIIVGTVIAALTGTGIYFATRKGKNLGDLNTAKSKSGRVRQRKAVFAKLDEAGAAWPKKEGVRVKPRTKKRKR